MHPHTRRALQVLGSLIVVGSSTLLWLSHGPDYELGFEREVHSSLAVSELEPLITEPRNWPDWHFNVVRVEHTSQLKLATGSRLKLFLEPPKKEWKRFELELLVKDFQPQRRLDVGLESESKGRLKKLLTGIHWVIELLPQPSGQGTLIRGTARAWTNGRRARLIGRLTPRILMNQIFYPDLEALAHPEKRKGRSRESKNGRLLPF